MPSGDCGGGFLSITQSLPRFSPVLDFQRGPKPRNYLSRREQGRLLFLVLLLGLVVIAAIEARNPDYYRWMWGPGGQNDDTLMVIGGPPESQKDDTPGTSVAPGPAKTDEATPSRYFPGVDPAYLEGLRDHRLVGSRDWDPLLHFFDVLRNNDEPVLRQASSGPVGFLQLCKQSEEYRGELITTKGKIRGVQAKITPRTDYGPRDYYQTWLTPDDHPSDLIMVWCLYLPEDFPQGMEIREEVEVTGFYYRMVAYPATDRNLRSAPLLLARTVHWRKRPPATDAPARGPASLSSLLLIIGGSAAFAALVTLWVYRRTRGRGPSRLEMLTTRGTAGDAQTPADLGAALDQLGKSEETRKP
jgi:hypothetical protein